MFSNLIARGISTTSCRLEMMQITKIQTFNKRGTKKFKKEQYKKWQQKGEKHLDFYLTDFARTPRCGNGWWHVAFALLQQGALCEFALGA